LRYALSSDFVHFFEALGDKLLVENKKIDVVIMNPPFGTKKKGIDMIFLQKALQV
jgi:predicted RNA methylase